MADAKIVSRDDSSVDIDLDRPTWRIRLSPEQAYAWAKKLIRQADKANKRMRGIPLYSRRDVEKIEEAFCSKQHSISLAK